MPNGVYSGFVSNKTDGTKEGLIALLGYPAKKNGNVKDFKYQTHDLIYINENGNSILLNQKEILDILSSNKEKERFVKKEIDMADEETLKGLIESLKKWINNQAVDIEEQEDGTIKEKMGKSALDVLNKLKQGDKDALNRIKKNITNKEIFSPDNFDLIAWFALS